jgi:ATP-dependent exoDNAse (exonuclease V) beta subunit
MYNSLLIEASAGSGKTYQLSNRFLALLTLGESPSDLIALTFTRKAAGEFSRRILNRLALGASSVENAERLAHELTPTLIGDSASKQPGITPNAQLPDLSMERFRALLAELITALDQLQLSTLDSFFTRLVSSFGPDLGLAGFEMLDEDGFALAREETLQSVLSGGSLTEQQNSIFLNAFTFANYGNEEARVRDSVLNFIEDYHEKLLQLPNGNAWGNAEELWPDNDEWPSYSPAKLAALQQEIESEIPESFVNKNVDKLFKAFVDSISNYVPGTPLPDSLKKYLFTWTQDALPHEPISFVSYKKEVTLTLKQSHALIELEALIRFSEIRTFLQRTQGIWAVVIAFESQYHRQARSQGKVSFGDLTLLLQQHAVLARQTGFNELAYRLDSQFKHWLLDEFQDTSRRQWEVIEPVINEAMIDQEGERSLFVVGDTKQSIYGWRGGEPRLFNEMTQHDDWERLKPWTMAESWRSSETVLNFVNLCCDPEAEGMSLFPESTLSRWHFQEHIAARELSGEVAVYQLKGKAEDGELSDKHMGILSELERIQPIERNLSCVILVSSNKQVQDYTQLLRENSPWPVEAEAAVSIASDSPLGLALLDWFRYLVYPADSFAWHHVATSPLSQSVAQFGEHPAEILTTARAQISKNGVSRHLADLTQALPDTLKLGEFQSLRLRQIQDTAQHFDTLGGSLEEWLRMLESQIHKEESKQGSIQVMTVHKSKGLEFDIVMLPELDGSSYDAVNRMSMLTKENEDHLPEHVMLKPNKEIIQREEVLDAQYQDWIASNCFERACNLYVALTRAARALYLFLDTPSKTAKIETKLNDAGWIHRSVGDRDAIEYDCGNEVIAQRLYQSGEHEWFEANPIEETTIPTTEEIVQLPAAIPRAGRKTASSEKPSLFVNRYSRSAQSGKEFGNQIHELFELIETVDDLDKLPKSNFREHLRKAVLSDEGARWFKPSENTEVLREQSIEAVDANGVWFSGVVDRANIVKNENGEIREIAILDFKTDRVDSAEQLIERYASQLDSYRHYLADAFQVSLSIVSASIYSTALETYIDC